MSQPQLCHRQHWGVRPLMTYFNGGWLLIYSWEVVRIYASVQESGGSFINAPSPRYFSSLFICPPPIESDPQADPPPPSPPTPALNLPSLLASTLLSSQTFENNPYTDTDTDAENPPSLLLEARKLKLIRA